MSTENTPPVDPTGVPPVVEGTPPSGLPSDNTPQSFEGFELTDDLKGKFKDGKLNGRFGSVQEVLDKLKEAEDFKANTIRDQTNDGVANAAQIEKDRVAAAALDTQQTVITEMIPAFMANGMQLTAEMETQATEAGIDIRDLKLGAIELRDRVTIAHTIVGGAEEYSAMLAWGKEAMTDTQKAVFDTDVTGGMSEYAIKGLYSDYQAAIADGTTTRLEGSTTVQGLKPYADRKELYADKAYVESPRGRNDAAAIKRYNDRKRITPDIVIFGREKKV